ncbi:hypothetical protein CBF_1986 [Clostridium botulinum F str. 230613]|uniref:Uncharacterized protein n=1 Tax=Clostridium botulinum (strain Langeland / NCTC 10281 / Type F) TaxID=441772 RepID=A7GEQ1_CLOBL|nr:hypothetical protein CLI_2003 [Clostridium botulinum F str. Langeland]ADF99674.1 hypothetical protein CBF_1986 [Clostridium botulinum F str. 230613]
MTLDKVKFLSRYIEAFKYTKYGFYRVCTNIITNNYRYGILVYT